MKGTNYNGSHFANKGTSRSEGEAMFAVNNTVAFSYSYYCSPDGRSHSSGCCPSIKEYLLQEEILLEEYDNTKSSHYGSGNYDVKKIVELPDVFWHEYSTDRNKKTFLLQILEDDKNVFLNNFISGDITEVRNNPGKFLHIYEVPEGYRKCKKGNFADSLSAINLQKKQEDEGTEIISQHQAGEAVDTEKLKEAYIMASQWVTTDGEYLSLAKRAGIPIAIAVARANGHTLIQECLQSWVDAGITDEDMKNVQSDKDSGYNRHYFIIREDWKNGFYIAGEWYGREAIRTLSLKKVNETIAQHITAEIEAKRILKQERKVRFDELSKTVNEKYGEEVLKLVLRKKGSVLSILKLLSESVIEIENEQIKKILTLTSEVSVITNLMVYVTGGVDTFKAAKVAKKAYAWAYLNDTLPGVAFVGYFDSAKEALEIYSKNWNQNFSKSATNTIGEFLKK